MKKINPHLVQINITAKKMIYRLEDYINEAEKQLYDEEVYEEFDENLFHLGTIIMKVLRKIKSKMMSRETLGYFLVTDPKLASFHILPKICKRLHPGGPNFFNWGYCTENI